MKRKEKKPRGVNVTVSPQAYEKVCIDAFNAKPRRSLREQVNFINQISLNN